MGFVVSIISSENIVISWLDILIVVGLLAEHCSV